MLDQVEMLTRHISGKKAELDYWLDARKQLLVSYYQMVGFKPNRDRHVALDDKALDIFCHNLLDYLSEGHFKIYDQLIQKMEKGTQAIVLNYIYPSLQANMKKIVEIYDTHFENAINDENCHEFQAALSEIGERLEERFMLEDKLNRLVRERKKEATNEFNDADLRLNA